MEFYKTSRGKECLIYNEKIYCYDKSTKFGKRWRCKNKNSCKGSVTTAEDNVVTRSTPHKCVVNNNDILIFKANLTIKDKVNNTNEPFNQIFTTVTKDLSQQALVNFTNFEAQRDYSTRKRNKRDSYNIPPEQDIPPELQLTLNKQKFLQYDSGITCPKRFLVFLSEEFKELIKDNQSIIIDGTFKSSPAEYYQIITLQFFIFGKYIPLIFILVKEKTESCYDLVFRYIKDTFNISAKYVVIDFEYALKKTAAIFSKYNTTHGCIFHFSQCIWRKIQEMGLSTAYKQNEEIRKIFKLFFNLSYFSEDKNPAAYNYILETITSKNLYETFKEFITYFERNYQGSISKLPLYEVSFWSVYKRNKENIARSTNSLEGFHRSLNQLIGNANPNIGKLIDTLRIITEKNRVKLYRAKEGIFNFKKDKNETKDKIRKILADNENYYTVEKLFSIYENLNHWKHK